MSKGLRFSVVMSALAVLLAVAIVLGVAVGSSPTGLAAAARTLVGGEVAPETKTIVFLRLRRVMMGVVVGASLAAAGVALQALLRNVLADPYILGVSGGGALGASIYIFLAGAAGLAGWTTSAFGALGLSAEHARSAAGIFVFSGRAIAAFSGSLAASAVVLLAGRRRGHIMPATLLLVGVMVNAVCGAAVLALTYLADQARSHAIVVWLMGNLSTLGLPDFAVLGVGAAAALFAVALWSLGGRLNVLSLGDEQAAHLGVNVAGTRVRAFAFSAVITGLAVALAGPIGFVGLLVPHITRMLVGADHRLLFPASFVFGAAFLVLADTVARSIRPGDPLPVGVLTAALGGPFFIWLLRARRGRYFE